MCVCVLCDTGKKKKNQKYTQYCYKQNKTDKDFINSFWDGFQKKSWSFGGWECENEDA